jgi:hypothetical protein
LAGTWTDLGSEEFGGGGVRCGAVRVNDHSITYAFKEPVAADVYTMAAREYLPIELSENFQPASSR